MKNNKKLIGVLIGLVCMVLTFVLVLVMCNNRDNTDPTQPSDTTATTQATVETTQATVPSETTAPVEETTAPTVETQPAGNSTPGGNGGYNPAPQPTTPEETVPQETEPPVEVDKPGTETNAYYESVNKLPGSFTTVKIPAKSSVYYRLQAKGQYLKVADSDAAVVLGGKTYKAENGTVIVPLAGVEFPVLLQFVNNAASEKAFTVTVSDSASDEQAPTVPEETTEPTVPEETTEPTVPEATIVPEVMVGEKNVATLEENAANAEFTYTAYQDGMLKLTMDWSNYSGWYMQVTNLTTGEVVGEINSDGFDNYISLDVKTDDVLQILVNTHEYDSENTPAGEVVFHASFVSGTGTQEDPYTVQGMDFDIPVAAGQTVYCTGRFSGMIANIYGEELTVENDGKTAVSDWGFAEMAITGGDFFNPPVFTLTNNGADALVNVQMVYPFGSNENPQDMYVGEKNTATLEANDQDGYYFRYTSYEDGMLKIAMDPENMTEWFFSVENRTQGYFSDWHYSDSDPYVTSEILEVKAGDEIYVQVNTYNSMDMWDTPAGDVSFIATFVSGNGTEEEPYHIQGLEADITVGAGQTVYCTGRFSGMIANIYGENVTVENDGKTAVSDWGFAEMEITGGDFFNPPVFTLTNTGAEEATFNVLMTYPWGSNENPAELWAGEKNTASLGAASQGYYYKFTAYEDGNLTITMDPENMTGWFFSVENRTQGYFGDWHYSDSDPLVTSETVAVFAGDEVIVQVNTYDPENMWEAPAGDVSFTATFVSGSGTQEDPYQIQGLELDVAVGAGETLYYTGRYSGMVLNLTGDNATVSCNGKTVSSENGVAACPITGGSMWEPPVFTITNNGEDAVYHIAFGYQVGTMDNPDTLTVGSNTVSFDAGSMEYYFSWIAPKAGTLTIAMAESNTAGWQYCVNNMTTYQYGDNHSSDDATVVTSETLTVSEGDEIQFRICTFDPSNPWEIPAGQVTYTVTFE